MKEKIPRPQSLYILASRDGKSIKIGISNNVQQRFNKLASVNAGNVDLSQSYEISMKSGARKLENLLHYVFDQSNEKREQADGFTEWFSAEVLEDCLEYIKRFQKNRQDLSVRISQGISKISNSNLKTPLTPEEKKRKFDKAVKSRVDFQLREMVRVNSIRSEKFKRFSKIFVPYAESVQEEGGQLKIKFIFPSDLYNEFVAMVDNAIVFFRYLDIRKQRQAKDEQRESKKIMSESYVGYGQLRAFSYDEMYENKEESIIVAKIGINMNLDDSLNKIKSRNIPSGDFHQNIQEFLEAISKKVFGF